MLSKIVIKVKTKMKRTNLNGMTISKLEMNYLKDNASGGEQKLETIYV